MAAYGVPVPWLAANVPFPLNDIHLQAGFVAFGFVTGAVAGMVFRGLPEKPSS
ncbi:hypothetical protein [Hydrogenophaga sp.]|uniref:hypothetical protein n=1 Tax=Hydrogenophaga sp. TaxID=1904254 RepID=UPI00273005D4|nr:hypothetical protein [Hydrogenophaga sp.]MDP2016313.1 hypothetical protein [Hydrogenophaga sp.]